MAKLKSERIQSKHQSNDQPDNLPPDLEVTLQNVAKDPDSITREEAINALANAGAAFANLNLARAAGLSSPDFASELNNIDFHKMIGGPLQAAVDAQVASSLATVDYINNLGFKEPNASGERELIMVDFSHTRKDGIDPNGNPIIRQVVVEVPLLAMLPVPALRIEHVIIDFNVKLNSVESSQVSTKLNLKASGQAKFGPINFKVSAAYQRKTATGLEVRKEYALNVNVKAVQDEIPAGLEKILGILSA